MPYRTIAGRYQLTRRIGTGGTADVYEATDTRLNRTVAIKLLHNRLMEDEELASRLRAEVAMTRRLRHPGIVEVYDASYEALTDVASTDDGTVYLVMEYMPGGDLRKRLLSLERLPASEVERIARGVLATLQAAHEQGIVHRDLKPRNILFSAEGNPKIADFGLARSVTAAGLFEHGVIAGTPEYTAPETVTSSLWDARSDLYALGCTLYEAATGSPPFMANTPAEVLRLQIEGEVPPLDAEAFGSQSRLAALVGELLRKDPNERPQTATEAMSLLDESRPTIAKRVTVAPCPSCGAPLSTHYGWCFTCGKPDLPVQQQPKGYVVLVTGPGRSTEKCTPEFRDLCCHVAESVGLEPGRLRKSVPRLPFVLANRLDYGGAVRLRDELTSQGAEVTVVGPGEERRLTLFRAVGRKAIAMTPRVYLVVLGMGGAWFNIVRSVPPSALVISFAALLASVPLILTAAFARSGTRWDTEHREGRSASLTRLLATVRDPLIHARMKSVAESVATLLEDIDSNDAFPDGDLAAVYSWAEETVDRAAGLCLALDTVRSGRSYAAQNGTPRRADELRELDALYTRILELLGTTALQIRELAVRSARLHGSSAAVNMSELTAIVSRFADESEAWREIRQLEGATP